ncbi:MAG TPA: hypothetical protein HPP83_05950, partial [Candidatus Hydrogenedentes bacterium]|nr:hypothetical protein [Candidatus Hydrogenedentota bacterium]
WTAFAPIIPFDLAASTLPVVFLSVFLTNPTDAPFSAATVLNWENLCGCIRGQFPVDRGSIRPFVMVAEAGPEAPSQEEGQKSQAPGPSRARGLSFGVREAYATNAHGNYCLATLPPDDVAVSFLVWDERDPEQLATFWRRFHDVGHLGNEESERAECHSGALCCSCIVAPKQSRAIVYALSWYCPRFVVNGEDLSNNYTNTFQDAIQAAVAAMKYQDYYWRAVDAWQKRILGASLPRWLSRMLINNNCVFSTNTLLTRSGRFAMMETPCDPVMGALDRRFYSSLGTLLFYPALEERELSLFARTQDRQMPGRIVQSLGKMSVRAPSHGPDGIERIDINAKFVLMAYRDYHMTGNLAVLKLLFPRVRQAMEYLLEKDANGDGLPEQSGCSSMYDGWAFPGANSYTSSLWVAALRAYAILARRMDDIEEAKKYERLLRKAISSFKRRFWNEIGGYYRLYDGDANAAAGGPHDGCHTGQLAGQWFADFACLGDLFPQEQIERALEAIFWNNTKKKGMAEGMMPNGSPCQNPPSFPGDPEANLGWPNISLAHYAALQIYRGDVDRGLHVVQKVYNSIHVRRGRPFNQPLRWDLDADDAAGWGADRHMASLSAWHVLYALEGFYLDIPNQALWIRPHLPRNVYSLSAPLFTPLCFGWLNFAETAEGEYRQQVQVSFDSPVKAKTIVLRIPAHVKDVRIDYQGVEEPTKIDHFRGSSGRDTLIEILPKEPIVIRGPVTITLNEVEEEPEVPEA